MATVMEAKAVISAEDKTKGVFDAIGRKLSGLGKSAKISAEIDRTTRALGAAEKKLVAIDRLTAADKTFSRAEERLRAARVAHDVATKAFATGGSKTLQSAAERTALWVDRSTAAVDRHRTALQLARREVERGGLAPANLPGERRRLLAYTRAGESALQRQVERQAGLGAVAPRHPDHRVRTDRDTLVAPMAALAPAAAGYGAYRAAKDYAEAERRLTRIGITADASRAEMREVMRDGHRLAREIALPYDKVVEGYEVLSAQGRGMREMRGLVPAVARTAQASGSEVGDIARTADTVATSFGVRAPDMQEAFDIMVAGGKAGQFELKDMARYLPSLGPAASAIGFTGKEGLTDLVAMLQVMRKGAGTAEEAVGSMNNILSKMEADKITKAFKDVGIDSEKEFAKARKEGRNLVAVFEELMQKATKGDRSKIGDFIDDMEFKRGVQALMQYKGEWQRMSAEINRTAPGSTMTDLSRVLEDSLTKFDRMTGSAKRFGHALGEAVQPLVSFPLDNLSSALERFTNANEAVRRDPKGANDATLDYLNRYFGKPDDHGSERSQNARDALSGDEGVRREAAVRERRGELALGVEGAQATVDREREEAGKREAEIDRRVEAARKRQEAARANAGNTPRGRRLIEADQARIDEAERERQAPRERVATAERALVEARERRVEFEGAVEEREKTKREVEVGERTRQRVEGLGIDKPGDLTSPRPRVDPKAKAPNPAFGFGAHGESGLGPSGETVGLGERVTPVPPARPADLQAFSTVAEAIGKAVAPYTGPALASVPLPPERPPLREDRRVSLAIPEKPTIPVPPARPAPEFAGKLPALAAPGLPAPARAGPELPGKVEATLAPGQAVRLDPPLDLSKLPQPPSLVLPAPPDGAPRPPDFSKLEATVRPDQIRAELDGRVPVDVTGKVQSDVKVTGSTMPMMITIKVDGNGQVVGGPTRTVPVQLSGSGSGSGSTGTSMASRPDGAGA